MIERFSSSIRHFCAKMQDILVTDVRYLFPCLLKWFYHRRILRDITRIRIKNPLDKKANLYQHGRVKFEGEEGVATLILHGQYSHPFLMRHLASVAEKAQVGSTFSLYVHYDEEDFDSHRTIIKQAIDKIETMLLEGGSSLKGIILVGHSMGAIEAAYLAFVENDRRILSVISIAGRLKVVPSVNSPCSESLRMTLNEICQGVKMKPELPLYQIVGRNDWNAPLESTLIRSEDGSYHIVEDGMHFNILFNQEIHTKLPEFLQKSISF